MVPLVGAGVAGNYAGVEVWWRPKHGSSRVRRYCVREEDLVGVLGFWECAERADGLGRERQRLWPRRHHGRRRCARGSAVKVVRALRRKVEERGMMSVLTVNLQSRPVGSGRR